MVGYGQRDGCSRYPRWWDARCFGRVYSRRLAGCTTASIVVPANAGTHNHRCMLLRRVVATAFARQKAVATGPGSRPGRRLISSLALRLAGTTGRSAFHERLLDHEMTGLAVIAFGKTARFEHLAQLFQHGRAAAHHDPIGLDIQRRLADIVKQLL